MLYSGILGHEILYSRSLDTGIGIYAWLFHKTKIITHSFDLFIYIIGAIVNNLQLFIPDALQGDSSLSLALSFGSLALAVPPLVKAEVVYSNAENQKDQILRENKDKAGIYRWTNLIVAIFFPQSPLPPLGGRGVRGKKEAGKTYVGSSVNLGKRLSQYYSDSALKSHNMSINKAI